MARLVAVDPPGDALGVALVLPGGRNTSRAPGHALRPASLRLYPFLAGLLRRGRTAGIAVCQVHWRELGWNDGERIADGREALAEVARRYGAATPVAILGHSLGGRVGAHLLGEPAVLGGVLLAAWLPRGEAVDGARDRTVVVAHGGSDRITDPAGSYDWALRARPLARALCGVMLRGGDHAMLARAGAWQRLGTNAALGILGIEPFDPVVANGFAMESSQACRVEM